MPLCPSCLLTCPPYKKSLSCTGVQTGVQHEISQHLKKKNCRQDVRESLIRGSLTWAAPHERCCFSSPTAFSAFYRPLERRAHSSVSNIASEPCTDASTFSRPPCAPPLRKRRSAAGCVTAGRPALPAFQDENRAFHAGGEKTPSHCGIVNWQARKTN